MLWTERLTLGIFAMFCGKVEMPNNLVFKNKLKKKSLKL